MALRCVAIAPRAGQTLPDVTVAIARRDGAVTALDRGFDGWWVTIGLAGTTVATNALLLALGARGSDLPAQLFRARLVHDHGLVVWNNQWFAGHATLPYGVLSPIVGSILGTITLLVASGGVSVALFHRLTRSMFVRSSLGPSLWFAVAVLTNALVGRAAFLLGVTFALAGLLCLARGRTLIALPFAALASVASPLAGLFLVVGAAGWWLADRTRRRVAAPLALAASIPVIVVQLAFPQAGTFPYLGINFAFDLLLCAVAVCIVPARHRVLRVAIVVYAVVATGSFVLSSAVGGNISRLGQMAAGPILIGALGTRRWRVALLAAPLMVWQVTPAIDSVAYARHDPSLDVAYYQPLIAAIQARPGPIGRTEIPFTYRHWETYFAAEALPLARGWERQLDIAYNPVLYRSPTPASYHQWLLENGVRFVALPDARLDASSVREGALLRGDLGYLKLVWHDAHWKLWEVRDFAGLADGGATVKRLAPDGLTVAATRVGTVRVRVRDSSHWAVRGAACVSDSEDGWLHLQVLAPGRLEIHQALGGTPCPEPRTAR